MAMVSVEYAQTMARYNAWQNEGLRDAVQRLPEADLRRDRGAFFGSIFATMNHLLWADGVWMARIAGVRAPPGGIADSVAATPTLVAWSADRARLDGRIRAWADRLRPAELRGDLRWRSGALGREVTAPVALCVCHMFNHQTHHRGQIHAMLTAAGVDPGGTDLFAMPGEVC